MVEIIKETFPVARKQYVNEGYEWIINLNDVSHLKPKPSFAELRLMVSIIRKHKFKKIEKGEKYIKQVNKYDGDVYIYWSNIECHKLCCKYDLFPEL